MTEKELENLFYIRERIKRLNKKIDELEQELGISGRNLTGMPHSTNVSKPTEAVVMKKFKLLDRLKKIREKQVDEEMRLTNYIESIESAEIQFICELRFIDLMNWFDIGIKLNMDRTTASKKVQHYLETH